MSLPWKLKFPKRGERKWETRVQIERETHRRSNHSITRWVGSAAENQDFLEPIVDLADHDFHSMHSAPSLSLSSCLVAKKNLKEKRKRFGAFGQLYYLMLASFNGFNFINEFLQKLANCDIKKHFCAFSLKIRVFYQFETCLWVSHFMESLIIFKLNFLQHYVCQMMH